MKSYEVHYVERGGFPGACFAWFEAKTDKEARTKYEPYFNRSVNTGHCGIRIFRVADQRCIFKKFRGA
jgi:hypothetical protein